MSNIKVLSVRHPWAWSILEGHKTIENRTWSTPHRGPILLHAGKSSSELRILRKEQEEWESVALDWEQKIILPPVEEMEASAGCVVGIVYVSDILPLAKAKALGRQFTEGPFCWVLEKVIPIKVPIPLKGSTLLFSLPPGKVGEVRAQFPKGKWPKEWK